MLYFGDKCVYIKCISECTYSLHICKPVSLLHTVVNMLGLIANGGSYRSAIISMHCRFSFRFSHFITPVPVWVM